MSAEVALPEVGSRIAISGNKATVRYVGPVSGQAGDWVGVEWDDPTRGKHDGSTGGTRYFTAEGGATAGSFLRAVKLPKRTSVSVLDALKERYLAGDPSEEEAERDKREMYVETAGSRRVDVQFVGVDKIKGQQARMELMSSARLVDEDIDRLGDAAALTALVPSLTEINLSGVMASSWDFATALAGALPKLSVLNLSASRLSVPDPFPSGSALSGLKTLLLNQCGLTWNKVQCILPHLPTIEALHLEGNNLSGPLTPPEGALKCLKELRLGGNAVGAWVDVTPLGSLPALESLDLGANPVGSVARPEPSGQFASLRVLLLASCGLNSWSDVDALDAFASLQETRLTGNPVIEEARTGGRYEIVGRVGALTMLNGAAVRAAERRDSELRYMRQVLGALPDMNDEAHLASAHAAHPRLAALIEKYGMPTAATAAGAGAEGTSLASGLVEVQLTCVAASAGKKMGTQAKKLPLSMEISKLKLLCEKLFKLKVARQAIFMRSSYDPMPEEIGQDDSRTLYSLGLQPGQEVLIDEFDPEAKRKAEENARREAQVQQEALMQQQLEDREAVEAAAAAAQ